jgi:membrane-associated protein
MMGLIRQLVETLLDLRPDTINAFVESVGPGPSYAVLFQIIFAETGLVLIPFLPGDSLLFAVGAVCAHPDSPLNLGLTAALLVVAAVLGDAVNYVLGYYAGPAVFSSERSRLLNKKHLSEAHQFYETYGGKTIILARFIPIVRTFAPFVAGIGRMNYFKFAIYNVVGGVAWVLICLSAGWFLGQHPFVQKRFELVIVAIVAISVLPAAVEVIRSRLRPHPAAEPGTPAVAAGVVEPTVAD